MSHDSPSHSAVFGRFRTLDERLDNLDQVVVGGVAAADQVFPGVGASRGAWKGFPVGQPGGPALFDEGAGWILPDNSLAFKMPGFAPIGVPALHSAGTGNATLTGTFMGWPGMDFEAPVVVLPTWARPSGDRDLEDCAAWRIRWVTWPEGAPGFEVVHTDIVNGHVNASTGEVSISSTVVVPDLGEDIEIAALFLDFQISSWWDIVGSPPEVRPYEVYQIAMDSIDTSAPWPVEVVTDARVLVQWVSGEGQQRGIYVVGNDGSLALETTLFDGWHDGSVVWAYSMLLADHSDIRTPSTWGVYTTEFCSVVQLSGPDPANPLPLAPSAFGTEFAFDGGDVQIQPGEARPTVRLAAGSGHRNITFAPAGYGRMYETDIRVLIDGAGSGDYITWSDSRGDNYWVPGETTGDFYIHAVVIDGGYNEVDPIVWTYSPNLLRLDLD